MSPLVLICGLLGLIAGQLFVIVFALGRISGRMR